VSSSAAETPFVPKGGVPMDNLDYHKKTSNFARYGISKAGNYLQGAEFARRYRDDGIVSIPLNPGNLDSDLWRTQGAIMSTLLKSFVLHPVIYGAYTQLFAGLSPEVTMARTGDWGESGVTQARKWQLWILTDFSSCSMGPLHECP
jgi:hypothetical protein